MKINFSHVDRNAIAAYLEGKERITVAEISDGVFGTPIDPSSKSIPKLPAIVAALKALGWRRMRQTGGTHYWEKG